MEERSEVSKFYTTGAWRKCRADFIAMKKGMCERCYAAGKVKPIEHVHHKIRLTAENVKNPAISMNFKNLEGLCEECHKIEHGKQQARTDINGHVEL